MKRKVLSLLLCGVIACSTLTACGGSNSSNNAGVSDSDVSEKKDAEADSSNIEDLYVEAINSYQDYYEKVKSDFSGSQVGATITLDEEGLPLLWVAISEDGSKDNCRTQLVGYVDGKAVILTERKEHIVPTFSSGIVLGSDEGESRKYYLYDDEKRDFRNITNELDELSKSDSVYSESELQEKLNYLYPILLYSDCEGKFYYYTIMNESTEQVAYIGKYTNTDFTVLNELNVIEPIIINGAGDIGGYYLRKEYEDNKFAKQYYEKLAVNNRALSASLLQEYESKMASADIKSRASVFTSYDGTVFSTQEFEALEELLGNDGWSFTRIKSAYTYLDDVEIGQLFRKFADNPVYSSEELYLTILAVINNCEITEISLNDYDIQSYIEEENANKWRDIYLDGLEDGTIMNVYHYGLIDLIGDGIPELLCDDGFNTAIYTIVEDEVVQLTYTDGYPRVKDDLLFFDGKYAMKVIKICTDNVEVLFNAEYDREYDNYEFDGKTLSRDESLAEAGKVIGTDVESLPSVDLSYDVDSIEDAIKEY